MTKHIMLDLETWGTKPGCDIRSIGAVVFDPIAGTVETPIVDTTHMPEWTRGIGADWFYAATDNPYGRKYPLTRDPKTVQWWNDQSPEAQAAFANPVDLREACGRFAEWLVDFDNGNYGSSHITVWSNGPHFDIAILQAVFDAVGLDEPWHYRAPRDFRTIVDAAGMHREDYCTYGDAHNALHDAVAQAMTVCEAYKRLGIDK